MLASRALRFVLAQGHWLLQTIRLQQANFHIQRGARQGDVLSPLLFIAALQSVMKRWKMRLSNHGLPLAPGQEPLTNLRYAGDLLLFGRSLGEMSFMFGALEEELTAAGLSINVKKTKMFTNGPESHTSSSASFVELGSQMVEMVQNGASHKYLGRMIGGDLRKRGQRNLEHRLQCAWMKFHEHQQCLTNRRIPIHLRLRLWSSVVTPTALHSLSSTPLTSNQLTKLDATHRRMLRKIVGWIHCDGDNWATTGHRMKLRFKNALAQCPVPHWSELRNNHRKMLVRRLEGGTAPLLARLAHSWVPNGARPRGRPMQRWME